MCVLGDIVVVVVTAAAASMTSSTSRVYSPKEPPTCTPMCICDVFIY